MIIRHKGIYRNRFDAPFIGTLISSISCPYNCKGCINDPLKPLSYTTIDADELIKSIASDPFNEGIILGGLEWSLQPEELYCLVSKAIESNMKVIIYTYHPNREQFLSKVPQLLDLRGKGIYVKYGKYDSENLSHNNVHYGVPLASKNQYIELL